VNAAGAGAAAVALAAWLLAAVPGQSGPPRPLLNEDVVRMVMTGVPERAILERMATSPVAFDLTPEMIAELRAAGVGERILEAMRRRQAAMLRREPPAAPAPPPAEAGAVEIVFESDPRADDPSERTAIALAALPPGLPRRGGQEVATMTDMAFALLCLTPEHVPDHWDLRTPIAAAPRHQTLLFRAGAARTKRRGFEILYLDRQDAYRVELAAGGHRLWIAAAGKQAGSGAWRLLAHDEARLEVAPGGTTRVRLRARNRIRGSFMKGFDLEEEWRVTGVEAPAAGAAPIGEAA
jgi:hypothetical protein